MIVAKHGRSFSMPIPYLDGSARLELAATQGRSTAHRRGAIVDPKTTTSPMPSSNKYRCKIISAIQRGSWITTQRTKQRNVGTSLTSTPAQSSSGNEEIHHAPTLGTRTGSVTAHRRPVLIRTLSLQIQRRGSQSKVGSSTCTKNDNSTSMSCIMASYKDMQEKARVEERAQEDNWKEQLQRLHCRRLTLLKAKSTSSILNTE